MPAYIVGTNSPFVFSEQNKNLENKFKGKELKNYKIKPRLR